MRVFLDANVLFSASNRGSNIARLVWLVIDRGTAVISDFALEEARRNIELKRPGWIPEFQLLADKLEVVPSARFPLSVGLDDKDAPILCAAIQSRCDFLVTGDKTHFGHLFGTTIDNVRIVSLSQLALAINAEAAP